MKNTITVDPKEKSKSDEGTDEVPKDHKPEYEDTKDNLDDDESFEEDDYFEK